MPEILAALSLREAGWGGGSTIGGAPRHPDGSRSKLPPDVVFELVEAVVREHGRAPKPERGVAAAANRTHEPRTSERRSVPPSAD